MCRQTSLELQQFPYNKFIDVKARSMRDPTQSPLAKGAGSTPSVMSVLTEVNSPLFYLNGRECCSSESALCTRSPSGLVKRCLSLFSYISRIVLGSLQWLHLFPRTPRLLWGWLYRGAEFVRCTIPCCGLEAGLGVGGAIQQARYEQWCPATGLSFTSAVCMHYIWTAANKQTHANAEQNRTAEVCVFFFK